MSRKGRKCVLAWGLGCVPRGHHTQLGSPHHLTCLGLRLLSPQMEALALLILAVCPSKPSSQCLPNPDQTTPKTLTLHEHIPALPSHCAKSCVWSGSYPHPTSSLGALKSL